MKITLTIIALAAVFIAVPLIVKKEPIFTGTEYDGETLTANLFKNPVTFTDINGKLVTGYAVRYYPGTEQLYSKASFKDGIMHGPFVSYWENGQVQMSMVWDQGTRYKNMRSWDRDGKRLNGSGDEQIKQIKSMDKFLNEQMEEVEKMRLELTTS
tara:strand:- start:7108 stop:7572 length:465 start_codon:yes stop_codon:yes gene_type:complete